MNNLLIQVCLFKDEMKTKQKLSFVRDFQNSGLLNKCEDNKTPHRYMACALQSKCRPSDRTLVQTCLEFLGISNR